MSRKQMNEWIRIAISAGWTVTQASRGGHLKWRRPDGQVVVVTSTHPGKGMYKDRCRLRKAGLEIP